MARCPKCGNDVGTPIKKWPFSSQKSQGNDATVVLVVGVYECPNCKVRFKATAASQSHANDAANIKKMVERIKGIKGELMQTLKNLREKIKTLETERTNLMIEIDELRKIADARASALESEVDMLREEVKSIRDLLNYHEENEK